MPTRGAPDRASRELILDAALEAFGSRGYGSTTMSDLRRATGVSTGSLYHHFPSKEHVVAALFEEGVGDYQKGFAGALREARDTRAGIEGGVHFHAQWARRNRGLARLLLSVLEADIAGIDTAAAASSRQFIREVHGWLSEGVQRGDLIELPRELYYPVWIGPVQELTRQWLGGRTKIALTGAADALAASAWRSLRA